MGRCKEEAGQKSKGTREYLSGASLWILTALHSPETKVIGLYDEWEITNEPFLLE